MATGRSMARTARRWPPSTRWATPRPRSPSPATGTTGPRGPPTPAAPTRGAASRPACRPGLSSGLVVPLLLRQHRFNGMDHPDVLAWRDGHIEALDQTALPHQVRTLRIGTVDELVRAITSLAIRGAPVLGAAGALGVALAVRQGSAEGWDDTRLAAEIARIADARPTAVNLSREVAAVAARIGEGSAAVQGAALAVLESTAATSLRISAR